MGEVYCLQKNELHRYDGIISDYKLNSREEVATLLEVFDRTIEDYPDAVICDIIKDTDGYFYSVVDSNSAKIDLFPFINTRYIGKEVVNCMNARLLFPRDLSIGVYCEEEESVTGDSDKEETSTSYMDEEEIDKLLPRDTLKLYYKKSGVKVDIPEEGLKIGRSSKKVDFLIKGNDNVSRLHCKVYVEDGEYKVHDESSANGTFVNGVRVRDSKDIILKKGDILVLADEEFKVVG